MEGLTAGKLIGIWITSILEYWVLIVGFVGATVTGLRYLSNRSKQQQKNNDLLKGILDSSESMDNNIKEMSSKITDMNTEVKILRKEHDLLVDDHKDLKAKVHDIKIRQD